MTKQREWALFEDNGGGLHLFLLDDQDRAIFTSDYSHMPEQLAESIQDWLDNGDCSGWESNHDASPNSLYELFCDTRNGVTVVASGNISGTSYRWHCMGQVAKRALYRRVFCFNPRTGGEVLLLDTSHPDLGGEYAHLTDADLIKQAECEAKLAELTEFPCEVYIQTPLGVTVKEKYDSF